MPDPLTMLPAETMRAERPASYRFLVSVRSESEAALAAAAGVDVIDFKEPRDGPLAAVEPGVWRTAAERFPDQTLSAALGEASSAGRLANQVPPSFRFAKVGPSGLATREELQLVWNSLALPSDVELVPVAYADHEAANCVSVEEVFASAITTQRRRLLIDTFLKNGQTLFDHVSVGRLTQLLGRARDAGVWVALAGSVRLPDVVAMQSRGVTPDCWGVRGDVCVPGDEPRRQRERGLDRNRLAVWIETLNF